MDNLLADIAASFIRIEKGKRYQRLSRVATHLRQVAGFVWNWRPQCYGITGRNGVESLAALAWNGWPEWRGIRILSLEKAVDKELLTLSAAVLDIVKNRIQFEQDAQKEGSVE
jgi:hypothetical protein